MEALLVVYIVLGGSFFTISCFITLMVFLDGYPEEAKVAARVALGSLVWPIALPLALIYIALGGLNDKQKA